MTPSLPIRFSGTVHFDSEQTAVWHFLLSPEKTSPCVPGLAHWVEIEKHKKYKLVLRWLEQTKPELKVPIIVSWEQLSPPNDIVLSAIATPSSSNQLKINGRLSLTAPTPNTTQLDFTAEIIPPNPFLNQIIKNIFPKQIDRFFSCIKTKLTEQKN